MKPSAHLGPPEHELLRRQDFDLLVPSLATAGQPYFEFVERADAKRRIDAIIRARALWRERMTGERPVEPLRIGVLTPHASPGPEEEFPAMAPGCLATRVVDVGPPGDPPTTPPVLRALTAAAVLDEAARTLLADSIDAVGYASTTSAYVIGFDAEMAMVSRLATRLAVPVAATCASAVQALRVLEVEGVALIGAPWFETELNELGAAYFRSQGFEVVFSRSAELSQDPSRIEPAAVYEWTSQRVGDDAEAVFIGGNGFRAAGAIEPLESALGRPVLTSNQVLLWNLLERTGARCEINGYGRLFSLSA
jgi:maleate isomerase